MVRAIRREPFSFIHCILNIFSFQWFDWSFRADRLEPSAKLEVGLKDVSLKVEEEKIKWTLGDRSELFDQERLCSRGASLLARTPLCKQMWEERKRACRKTSENNIFCRQRRVCGIGWPWPIDVESPYKHIWFSCCVKCLNNVIINGIIKKMVALMMTTVTIVTTPDSRSLLGKHRQTDTAIQTYTD